MDVYPLLVDRFRRDASAVDEALAVLDLWDARGIGPGQRRREWRRLLLAAKAGAEGLETLIVLLLDSGEEARRLKDFAPFAGLLSREERRKAYLQCTYDH